MTEIKNCIISTVLTGFQIYLSLPVYLNVTDLTTYNVGYDSFCLRWSPHRAATSYRLKINPFDSEFYILEMCPSFTFFICLFSTWNILVFHSHLLFSPQPLTVGLRRSPLQLHRINTVLMAWAQTHCTTPPYTLRHPIWRDQESVLKSARVSRFE